MNVRRRYLSLLPLPAIAAAAALALFGGGSPATAQQPSPTPTAGTEPVELFRGCNNVSLTWPTGTNTSVVADAITPASNLIAIWRFNNVQQSFQGYSAQFPDASDLRTVNLIDAVFVCMTGPGTMTRPILPPR